MADRGGLFPYRNKKKGEVQRWHVRFPGQKSADYVASVPSSERQVAETLLELLRSETLVELDNKELRKVCQAKLQKIRAKASLAPAQETIQQASADEVSEPGEEAASSSVGPARDSQADARQSRDSCDEEEGLEAEPLVETKSVKVLSDDSEQGDPAPDERLLWKLLPKEKQAAAQADAENEDSDSSSESSDKGSEAPNEFVPDESMLWDLLPSHIQSRASSSGNARPPMTESVSEDLNPPQADGRSAGVHPPPSQPAVAEDANLAEPPPSSTSSATGKPESTTAAPPKIELECEVCYEEFNDKDRAPFLSKCGHTFCEACVHKILGKRAAFQCPVCRQTVARSECMKNVWILQNLSALLQQSPKRPGGTRARGAPRKPAEALGEGPESPPPRRAKRRRVNEPGFADPQSREAAPPREAQPEPKPKPRPKQRPAPEPPATRGRPGRTTRPEAPTAPSCQRLSATREPKNSRSQLAQHAQHEVSVPVPGNLMGRLIGPGGTVINEIQRSFHVVASARSADGTVRLMGDRSHVETCAEALRGYVARNCDAKEAIQVEPVVAGAFWPAELRALEREAIEETAGDAALFLEKRPLVRVELDKTVNPPRFRLVGTGAAVRAAAAKLKDQIAAIAVHEIEVPVHEQVKNVSEMVTWLRSMSGKRGISVEPSSEVLEMSESWMDAHEVNSPRALKVSLAGREPACSLRRDEVLQAARDFRPTVQARQSQSWPVSWWPQHQGQAWGYQPPWNVPAAFWGR